MSRPMTRSVRTDALAWLIEHPALSYDTSRTVSAIELDAQRDLVATGRVDVVHLDVERLPQALVMGRAVVIEDDLLVHRFELHQPKNLFALSSPATRASISDVVVYR